MSGSTTNALAQGTLLRDLLNGAVSSEQLRALGEVRITDLTLDSREVHPGAAFFALPGTREHGIRHAPAAVAQGAVVVLYQPPADVPSVSVPAIAIPELRQALGAIADRFFRSPSASMRIAAVTGTNGKTTTAWLIAAAMQQLGVASAYAGTLGVGAIGALRSRQHTTPDSITLHRELAHLRDHSTSALGMEVSSHALDQSRIAGVRIASAVFTNLTRDHLDYHGTLEAYGEAKARLFRVPHLRYGLINADDAFGRALLGQLAGELPLIAYSRAQSAFTHPQVRRLLADRIVPSAQGLELGISGDFGSAVLRSRLIGEFNAENLLAALGVLLSWEIDLARAVNALAQVTAPPGRMQTITRPGKPLAVVDYAHTPDALAKALRAARSHCTGKLICVFGCGGERDPGKRPLMGRIAAELADRVIVTDVNPRGEDGTDIVQQILAGLPASAQAEVERDRARAINSALEGAGAGDVVLVAGKGHEDYQIIGTERRHFSDAEVIAAWLEARA
ncbi:MAG: UDP-N-acetylmuramoyl-L-alanyl-D-glutamate--2,6-diaminopimelate ligase [Steroidobacteraceae bacterium]